MNTESVNVFAAVDEAIAGLHMFSLKTDDLIAARAAAAETGCANCGSTGLHACTGQPLREWTPQEKADAQAALQRIHDREAAETGSTGADGWIRWNGGNCPVAPETTVDVRLRDGGEELNAPASYWDWRHDESCDPILAYRIATPTQDDAHGGRDEVRHTR